ncbi:unnamed protein product [Thelazia callipaeda]|uniref:Uncharacterized protein n=1 Tax=Thelazia callipaeda TaxID=103827 RepID=A0A0N5CY06_THECL|nr:unnamed protein product [Thelazia callipaeda]
MKSISEPTGNTSFSSAKKHKLKEFVKKYFCEGQQLDENDLPRSDGQNESSVSEEKSLLERYRKYIGFLIPICLMELIWLTLAVKYNTLSLYPTRYELALTMILGATVAEFLISIQMQLCNEIKGMTSAAFTIIWMKIAIEWHSIIICSIGATAGIIFGLQWVDNLLDGQQKKMLFVSIWFSFALALFILNSQKKRKTYTAIPEMNTIKVIILLTTGIVGGLCSSFAGSGVDICSFSILTLLFRVSEKVATPTSVILMAVNTCVGFFWRQLIMTDISELAWQYFQVSVPVVVICAPLGSLIASHFHRLVLASFVYILEILALIGFLITRPPVYLILWTAAIILFSFIFFVILCKIGAIWSKNIENKRAENTELATKNSSLGFLSRKMNIKCIDVEKQTC